MFKKTKKAEANNAIKLGGINVYTDDKGRSVYYNRFNKSGYILTDHEKGYMTYSSRFVIGVIAGIFSFLFNIPILISLIIGVIVYLILEVKFRSFLKTLPQVPNFKPVQRQGKIDAEANQDNTKIIIKIILSAVFSVLIIYNTYLEGYTGITLYLNYLFCLIGIFMFIIEVRAFMIKKRNLQ